MGANRYESYLRILDRQFTEMGRLVEAWSTINSGSIHLTGLAEMLAVLKVQFSRLNGEMREIALPSQKVVSRSGKIIHQPLGRALLVRKRPRAALKVLLGCHMDTVFPQDHPYQKAIREDRHLLRGPGTADAKGGLVVMLKALEALESSPFARNLGWEVLINPDEEIGSPGSARLLAQSAKKNHLGLLFEPALPDGALARTRKGSGNFTVVVRGRSAHVGRDYYRGRSAIKSLADVISAAEALNGRIPHVTVSVGHIEGGGPVNVVPDLAICHLNIRIAEPSDATTIRAHLRRIVDKINQRDGISITVHGGFSRPPKPVTGKTKKLFEWMKGCAHDLGLPLRWRSTGGSCDGNNLTAAGLPTLDNLGVRGGWVHTDREYALLDSLVERSRLVALFLMKLGSGEIRWQDLAGKR